jgi:hypothetical protein
MNSVTCPKPKTKKRFSTVGINSQFYFIKVSKFRNSKSCHLEAQSETKSTGITSFRTGENENFKSQYRRHNKRSVKALSYRPYSLIQKKNHGRI